VAFPHGWTSSKVIGVGDPVVVDIGPILDGYDGDVCRTFTAGNKMAWRREHEVVQEAIHASLEALKSQEIVKGAQIDHVAREVVRGLATALGQTKCGGFGRGTP
jgi:Xaa-Pro aminopeptidase